MFSWQYNEKLVKDLLYNHANDFGRFYCQLMLDSPLIYREFMKGFHDELERRTRGNDTSSSKKDNNS